MRLKSAACAAYCRWYSATNHAGAFAPPPRLAPTDTNGATPISVNPNGPGTTTIGPLTSTAVASDPLTAIARGTGIILENLGDFREVLIENEDELPPKK